MINISRLDKAEVLAALYNHSHQQGMGCLDPRGSSALSVEEAREIIKERGTYNLYFDYLYGRVLKVDLSKTSFDPFLYDRDNGPDAAELAIMEDLDLA